jgi:hypothetical protein
MNIRKWGPTIPAFLVVAACGGGTPATVDEVKEKLSESMTDDDYTVTWVNVVEKEEPAKFQAFIDRVKKDDPETDETKICNVSMTSNSSSWSCQAAKPSMMTQAAKMLLKDYASRKIEVRDYHLERTGEGNAFTGYFELVNPNNGQSVKIPCKGDQKEAKFDIDCDQSYGKESS